MFVCVARVTLDIPASGSLKAKRQVLRRVTDRVKAKFNVSVAEVEDNELWNRAVVALSVVGNDRRHVNEQMEKILHFVDDMYVAPVSGRELEILSFGDQLFGDRSERADPLSIPKGDRSLAEAEGLGSWENRHRAQPLPPTPRATAPRASAPRGPSPSAPGAKKVPSKPRLSLDDARAVARTLRNPRDWEKKGSHE